MNAKSGSSHWAAQREQGHFALMKLTAWAARTLGRRTISPVIYLIVLYFYVTGRRARGAVRDYQRQLADHFRRPDLRPTWRSQFAQFTAFADALLDKLDVWRGTLRLEHIDLVDRDGIHPQLRQGRGQLLVGAHLGNLEVCRALAETGQHLTMNVLVHTRHAEQFNRLLGEAGASNLRLVQVSELDPATMLLLSERLDAGEWLAIAGDRVPLDGGRHVTVDFLGRPARLPQGPWLLAGLLQCPVNLFSCIKFRGRYRVQVEAFAPAVRWRRGERDAVIQSLAQRYADRLGALCLEAPHQWFNFFPFWTAHDDQSA